MNVHAFEKSKSHCSRKTTTTHWDSEAWQRNHRDCHQSLEVRKVYIFFAWAAIVFALSFYLLDDPEEFLKICLNSKLILRNFSCLLFISLMVALYGSLLALPSVWNGKFLAFDRRSCLLIGTMNSPGNFFFQIIQFSLSTHLFSMVVVTLGLFFKVLSCWQLEVTQQFSRKKNDLNLYFFINLKCKNNCGFHRDFIIFSKVVFSNVLLTWWMCFHLLCITVYIYGSLIFRCFYMT